MTFKEAVSYGYLRRRGNYKGAPLARKKCGKREWDDKEYKPKNDTQECEHEWEYYYPDGRRCTKCGVINL